MLASFRTFRLMAALMAVLLLLSGSLPLVQHACAMAQRHEPTPDQPCPRHEHDKAAAHYAHGPMHALLQAESSCSHEASRRAVPSDCCIVEAAPGIVANGVRLLKRSLAPTAAPPAAHSDALLQHDGGLTHALFFDTGPSPAVSVSRHLAYSVLLN